MELSNITKSNSLIQKQEWESYIDSLKTNLPESSKEQLKKILIEAVKKRIPNKKFGIMFSGGVDSSLIALICKQLKADFICYSVGLENASDIPASIKAAKEIGVELKHKIYTLEEIEEFLKAIIPVIGTDIVALGVAAVEYACIELAKKDNIHIFFTGLGSEEIFAGYHRHDKSKDINEECWNGLRNIVYQRDFTREYALANAFNITALTPFLDKEVIKAAMAFPAEQKISKENNKLILRQIAEELGLPKEISWRKKIAAQYGSKFDRAILRLARLKHFQKKKEYIKYLKDWL